MTDRQRAAATTAATPSRCGALCAHCVGAAALAAAGLASGAAFAAPAMLANDSDVAAFAARVKAYAGASRVRWIVAAPTQADAEALIANIGLHLRAEDRATAARASRRRASPTIPTSRPDRAFRSPGWRRKPASAPAGPACSWQVWVSDPSFPSPRAGRRQRAARAQRPFAGRPGRDVPRRLYRAAAIEALCLRRDAARRHPRSRHRADVNIPVAAGPGSETIVLAMARQPAPFLEGIRIGAGGQRRPATRSRQGICAARKSLSRARGIGANIQLVTPNMVIAKDETGRQPRSDAIAHAGDRAPAN